jgi:hypothetical protein
MFRKQDVLGSGVGISDVQGGSVSSNSSGMQQGRPLGCIAQQQAETTMN